MDVGADVLAYRQPDGSVIRGGEVLATRLNNASLAAKRGITVPLARDVLETLASFGQENWEACPRALPGRLFEARRSVCGGRYSPPIARRGQQLDLFDWYVLRVHELNDRSLGRD